MILHIIVITISTIINMNLKIRFAVFRARKFAGFFVSHDWICEFIFKILIIWLVLISFYLQSSSHYKQTQYKPALN